MVGEGFAVWGLRALYRADPPCNCFPSLHVAHSFVSALVAMSTVFIKQHYVLDVIAGTATSLTLLFRMSSAQKP